MSSPFRYFVVLAGMRTGSNFLEEQLNAMPGVMSHGELFNPHFFGKPEAKTLWGLSMQARDSDPMRAIGAMRGASDDLNGFRLFHDHSTAALDHVLRDPMAAKIVLSRRPVDSYVSLKIARKTGQWWLSDMTSARDAKVAFDAEEYAEFLNDLDRFQGRIKRDLQTSGQTAFHVDYDELSDPSVLSGLGKFLGSEGPPDPALIKAKVQNPTPVVARLTNPRQAEDTLSKLSAPDLGRINSYEPDRGPGLKFFRACQNAPLLYMPIRGASRDPVPDWMTTVDPRHEIASGMTQKDLRKWKRSQPGNRSFTVLRHPLQRAHDAFCRNVLPTDVENYADIRAALMESYQVPLSHDWPDNGWSLEHHQKAFLAFLHFLAGNLGGQTGLRVDNTWATQTVLLGAIGQLAVPDRVIREENLAHDLSQLCDEVGVNCPSMESKFDAGFEFSLSEIVTPEIEKAAAAAYRRDYVMFGFTEWSAV